MLRRAVLAAGGAAVLGRGAWAEGAGPVDMVLVLAVDVSRSIDEEEARLQREGYRAAMVDPGVVAAVTGGPVGAIGVTYIEWAGIQYQQSVLPWRRLGSAADCARWAGDLARAPRESLSWTSISGALIAAGTALEACPFLAARKVVDVSGDGVNNSGPAPEMIRDMLVGAGVVINGLPIVNDRPNFGRAPTEDLEQHYRERVIGGEGAFLVVAEDFEKFGAAIRRKLITEIAARPDGAGRG